MPEGYTHIRTAKRAASMGNINIFHINIFSCGANGPDILFSYRIWKKKDKRGENLPKTGERLHNENTGIFLKSLIENADTEIKKEYTLGFLSHYAADCTLHPYIVMTEQKGKPYNRIKGHGFCEIAIDSSLHKKDTGTGIVRQKDNCPKADEKEISEAAFLLKSAIKDSLGEEISHKALCDTFKHTRILRKFFISPFKILYGFYYLIEPIFGGRGFITCHVTPAKLKTLPKEWENPFTKELSKENLSDLLKKAEKLSLKYMQSALSYWNGNISIDEVTAEIGSKSYLKGIDDHMSKPC